MLNLVVARIVDFCTRHVWPVIIGALVVAVLSGVYTAQHFVITTEIQKLISPDLPWRKRELAYESVFPQGYEMIFTVVDA